MAVDLLAEKAVGETEATFGLKCVSSSQLVGWLAREAGVCLDDDRGAVLSAATYEAGKGLLVTDSWGRTFRLKVAADQVAEARPAEKWRHCFREGFLPALRKVTFATHALAYRRALQTLQYALLDGDERICRGGTVEPSPSVRNTDALICKACLVAFAGWQAGLLKDDTVGAAEEFFAAMCYEMDQALSEPAGCRHLLNWFDENPAEVTTPELLGEIDRALSAPAF